ncbi:MAG: hypothetical protein V7K27_06645 [Nostoc sp.]|uniref:hypothetical protein n=1 Tax=Nostoc sp. TaxID=1180 RepID=UPI002FFB0165
MKSSQTLSNAKKYLTPRTRNNNEPSWITGTPKAKPQTGNDARIINQEDDKQGYSDRLRLITKALYELNKVAGDQSKSLYDINKEVYSLKMDTNSLKRTI